MMIIDSPELPITHDPQTSALWEKLRRFSFDRGTGPRTFAARLAREQGWSESFTALAIDEYRRFLLLFALDRATGPAVPGACSAVRVVPSAVVDKVWHLHLLYTQSYWEDLCRDILAGPLHHLPADGSEGEGTTLNVVYEETLAAYRRTFGRPAPTAVWPGAEPTENPSRSALRAGTGSAQGSAGVVVLVGGGLLVALLLVLGHVVPPLSLVLAGIIAFFIVLASGSQGTARRRRSGNGGESAGLWGSGNTSDGGGTDSPHDSGRHDGGHHGGGHHGGSHDAGGHSHSCGGGHSCGGHGCGGHGCGGGSCGGH